MKTTWIRTFAGLEPVCEKAKERHQKGKLRELYHIDVKKFQNQRNARLNAKYWVMLETVVENSDKYRTKEHLHIVIKKCLGVVEEVYNPITRQIDIEVGSTAFENMPEEIFQRFYQDALTFCCQHVISGANEDEINQYVEQLLGFA